MGGHSSVQEVSSVPVNHPRNLWNNNKWQETAPGKKVERRAIEIRLDFTNGSFFTSYINQYYGFLNLNVKDYSEKLKDKNELARLVNSTPLLIPGIPGLRRHESPIHPTIMSEALNSGRISLVLRNVLYHLKSNPRMYKIIEKALNHHFEINLEKIE